MIVWSGRGIFSFLVFLIVLIASGLSLPEDFSYYGYVIASFVAAIFSWFFGIKWNNQDSRIVIDEKTGQRMIFTNSHRLFWLKMEYWGIIFWILGSLFLFYKSVIGSIISATILGFYIMIISAKKNGKVEKPIKRTSKREFLERESGEREAYEEERLRRRKEKEDPSRFMPK